MGAHASVSVVAVDARGDVLQWGGAGASNVEPEVPRRVLRNCDILRVAASKDKAYALSRSGNVIIFPSDPQKQLVGEQARQAADQWWKLRWLRGGGNPGTDCEQLKTDSDLARGEKCVLSPLRGRRPSLLTHLSLQVHLHLSWN